MCDKGLTQQAWVVQICTLERNDWLLTSSWEITSDIILDEIIFVYLGLGPMTSSLCQQSELLGMRATLYQFNLWWAGDWVTKVSYKGWSIPTSVQFSPVVQSCPTLCDPMNHSMPGLPVHHQLPHLQLDLCRPRLREAFLADRTLYTLPCTTAGRNKHCPDSCIGRGQLEVCT